MIKASGHAILQSAATAEQFVVEPADLQWQIGDRGSRRIGKEVHHVARIERTTSKGLVLSCEWTVAEFPPGTVCHVAHHTVSCLLVRNFALAWQGMG
ncbi:hypothetical protein [Pseudorhodoferax sp.]|uniref:hypothetical protein n=1 Tax=Pseudorhodoferax sp. TaxID=1993553 RepID=UPI002DD656BA|nr:hypothetical protein [Pseudorhodoferax sp.]